MKIFILTCLTIVTLCTSSYAQISTESYVTADDVTIAQMESNRLILTNAINSGDGALLTDLSVTSDKLDANANPENRWDEAFSDFVFSGLLIPISSSLTAVTPSGTAYIEGVRVVKDDTSKTYTADRYTYVDLSKTGVYTYQETTFGATVPAISLNSIRLAKVSAATTTIPDVTDERTTTLSTIASADAIIDTAGKTGIQTQETASENVLRFDTNSIERMILDANGLGFKGSTSGTTVVTPSAVAAGTITLPAETGNFLTTGGGPVIGTFQRTEATASGTQEVSGLGITPRYVYFMANESGTDEISWGFDDGTNTYNIRITANADVMVTSSTESIHMDEDTSNTYTGEITTLGTDGFTITWVRNSTPSGTIDIYYWAHQ